MLTRLNFLFSLSVLLLVSFGFAGRFVIFKAASTLSPGLTPYIIAAYMLATLMLTALAVAKLTIRLGPIAAAARPRALGMRGYGAQVLFFLAHLCVLFAIRSLVLSEYETRHWWPWLTAPALYFTGTVLFIGDLRRRALQPAG